MDESTVSDRAKSWLLSNGFMVKDEPLVLNGEMRMDYYAFLEAKSDRDFFAPTETPIWIECKGEEPLSGLLEGFIRLEFTVFYAGGVGILATDTKGVETLLRYRQFLSQSLRRIVLFDAEKQKVWEITKGV